MKVLEAKQKVCPFMENVFWIGVSDTPYSNKSKNINCICGECMAWEWKRQADEDGRAFLSLDEGYCARIGQ